MTRFVVDASVAVKWYLPEQHTDAARRLLDRASHLIVPELFFAEVGNVLWKRWRRGHLGADALVEILDALQAVPFEACSMRGLLTRAVEIGMDRNVSVYDGTYLAVAEHSRCPLVTADRRLLEAVAGSPIAAYLSWVEDAA